MNAIQKSHGIKHFIDIDIDMDNRDEPEQYALIERIFDDLKKRKVKYFVVNTKGGYHILMRRNSVKFNYNELINDWRIFTDESRIAKEIEVSNGMCPLPGTFKLIILLLLSIRGAIYDSMVVVIDRRLLLLVD